MSEVVVSDMFSHHLAILKRSEDITQNCKETFLIHQVLSITQLQVL